MLKKAVFFVENAIHGRGLRFHDMIVQLQAWDLISNLFMAYFRVN